MNLQLNIKAVSPNNFCLVKATNIKYFECVRVLALLIRQENHIFSAS
jgi:hypothetical protein